MRTRKEIEESSERKCGSGCNSLMLIRGDNEE